MKKKELILTPIKKLFPDKTQNLLMLGEWCKLPSDEDFYSKYKYKVLDYHWDDRKKLEKDFKFLEKINARILKFLCQELNNIYNLDYSERGWLSIIGPWLFNCTAILYDRWFSIKKAISTNTIKKIRIFKSSKNHLISRNMQHFSNLQKSDEWNHLLFSFIIDNFDKNELKNIDLSKFKFTDLNAIKYSDSNVYTNKYLIKIYSYLAKFNKGIFYSINVNLIDHLKILISEKSLPIRFRIEDKITNKLDIKLRLNLFKNFSCTNEFEKLIKVSLPFLIPTAYLESLKDNQKLALKFPTPKNPNYIWTSGAFYADEIFKIKVAESITKKIPYIIGQHGGFYGQNLFDQNETFETSVSDFFFSWGWSSKKQKNIIPVGCFKSAIKRQKDILKSNCFLIIGSTSRYSSSLSSMPISSQTKLSNQDQINFLKTLSPNVLSNVQVKPYLNDYKWDLERTIKKELPNVNIIDKNINYKKILSMSKLIICGWNSTTFLESMLNDIPTVVFWSKNYLEMRKETFGHYNNLQRVGIFHDNYLSAANHINKIHNNVDLWWNSKELIKAKKDFIEEHIARKNFPKTVCLFLRQLDIK